MYGHYTVTEAISIVFAQLFARGTKGKILEALSDEGIA